MENKEKFEQEGHERLQHSYFKAIQNLSDILVDDIKYRELCDNIFLALDEDESGRLEIANVEKFCRDFLKGTQYDGCTNTSFEDTNVEAFKILSESDSDTLSKEEMSHFLRELLKSQVKELQNRIEKERFDKTDILKGKVDEAAKAENLAQE